VTDIDQLHQQIEMAVTTSGSPLETIQGIRRLLHRLSPADSQPVDLVYWIPIDKVEPNNYNPNQVARIELGLLLTSIDHDGYTQPVVTIYDPDRDKYIIVDGFHRYFVMKANQQIYDRTGGLLPCVVIEKDINDRMASTIRHNRARGRHTVSGMSSMVFKMLDNGMTDENICSELGMEPEELLRLKHITGFSKLFADKQYNRSWTTKSQIAIRLNHEHSAVAESDMKLTKREED